MHFCGQYGHRDFVLYPGYKANVIKEYFLISKRWTNSELVVSNHGEQG